MSTLRGGFKRHQIKSIAWKPKNSSPNYSSSYFTCYTRFDYFLLSFKIGFNLALKFLLWSFCNNWVKGCSLLGQPSSHTTVRAVRHTTVEQVECSALYRLMYSSRSTIVRIYVCIWKSDRFKATICRTILSICPLRWGLAFASLGGLVYTRHHVWFAARRAGKANSNSLRLRNKERPRKADAFHGRCFFFYRTG